MALRHCGKWTKKTNKPAAPHYSKRVTLQQAKRGKASEQAFAASDMHQCKYHRLENPMQQRLENRRALVNVKTLENLEKLDNI